MCFKPTFLCTKLFHDWWSKHYNEQFLDVVAFSLLIDQAFVDVQVKTKKSKFTHVKEIQAFQKYFETVYRPDDVSRTVREAAVTLKEKLLQKMERLNISSNIPLEQRYKVAFDLFPPKFPRLPSADFGVALAPPFPDWFVCGDSIKILRQQSQPKAQRVVATKHTLDSFKGHLHIGIKDVHIESEIYEGWRSSTSCF